MSDRAREVRDLQIVEIPEYLNNARVQQALRFWNSFSLEEMTAKFNVPQEDLPFVFAAAFADNQTKEMRDIAETAWKTNRADRNRMRNSYRQNSGLSKRAESAEAALREAEKRNQEFQRERDAYVTQIGLSNNATRKERAELAMIIEALQERVNVLETENKRLRCVDCQAALTPEPKNEVKP